MGLANRIAKVEASLQRLRPDHIPSIVLAMATENEDPAWPLATEVGGQQLVQGPGEDEAAFKGRALAVARSQHDGDPLRPLFVVMRRQAQPTG